MGERVYHEFGPVFDSHSKILILGTMPSAASRRQQFYYGHPQNRFWSVIAALTNRPLPQTVPEKRALLLGNGIALWDVLSSCEIEGSSDASIRGAVANDMREILAFAPIGRIFANGRKAWELYQKYCLPETGREIVKLPSTSPANAAYNLERLLEAWRMIL